MAAALVLCASATPSATTPPSRIGFQGVLRNASGVPLDGTFDLRFVFRDTDAGCPAGGTILLEDAHDSVDVEGGLFSVALGGGTVTPGSAVDLADVFGVHQDVWIEIEVGGEVLCPRVRVESSAYSLNSARLDGRPSGGFLDTSSTPQAKQGRLTVHGGLDLGPGIDDDLEAADVVSLTGGGHADALHTHTTVAEPGRSDVRAFGAAGDGVTDDTTAIQAALDATPVGGTLLFPAGSYVVSDGFLVDKRINIVGTGFGTQIYQTSTTEHIFHLVGVQAAIVRDLYLGSEATAVGASLIKLTGSHHNRIEGVLMTGGYYGLHFHGSLLNTIVDLKTGANIKGFFAGDHLAFLNQVWVFADRSEVSSNANTFIAPSLEGGTNGFRMTDDNSEGNLFIYGGTIEGVAGVGLDIQGTRSPTVVSGVHFEDNDTADIVIDGGHNVRIESIFADGKVELRNTSRNVLLTSSVIDSIEIGPDVLAARLEGVNWRVSGDGTLVDNASDTFYQNVIKNTQGEVDWYSTIGVGTANPEANPQGATPDLLVVVDGQLVAETAMTGDLLFRRDGKVLWRMYEDESGLQLEDPATGEVSRVLLEDDVEPMRRRLEEQDRAIARLRERLAALDGGSE